MKQPTVAAGLAQSLLTYAATQGVEQAQVLAEARLSSDVFADPDGRIALAGYRRLVQAARRRSGDPLLHLRAALDTRFQDMSVVGLLVHHTGSMAESMRQFARYSKLLVEVDVMDGQARFQVAQHEDGLWIIDHRPNPQDFPELSEMALARFIGEFRRGFPDRDLSLELRFSHPAPACADAAAALYGLPVRYGAGMNGLRMAPGWLEIEFERPNRYAFGIFAEKADALLEALERDSSLQARVEAALLKLLHEGDPSMGRIADELALGRQTLYRRLREEGTSFARIVDALRRRMAEDYLAPRRVSVHQTAYLVGFSEPSSFVRAFRRWTGMTPQKFRDQAWSGGT